MPAEYAAQFRARQVETWRRSKLWLLLMAGGFVGGFFVGSLDGDSPADLWVAGLICFGAVALGIIMLTRVVLHHYRCPNCERPVVHAMDDVPFSPKSCPHCHAALR